MIEERPYFKARKFELNRDKEVIEKVLKHGDSITDFNSNRSRKMYTITPETVMHKSFVQFFIFNDLTKILN